jgi:hypothetical protein
MHIHANGDLESHADALDRLRRFLRLPEADLFREYVEILADAYRRQEERIAYKLRSVAAAGARSEGARDDDLDNRVYEEVGGDLLHSA